MAMTKMGEAMVLVRKAALAEDAMPSSSVPSTSLSDSMDSFFVATIALSAPVDGVLLSEKSFSGMSY